MRDQWKFDTFGSRTLWLTAAVFATIWAPQLQANEVSRNPALPAQAATGAPAEPRAVEGQDLHNAETLARELAATKRDLNVLLRLLNRACGASATPTGDETIPSQAPSDDGAADLRQSLQQERDRANRLEQDLAAARHDVEAQTLLAARASDEANQPKPEGPGTADLRQSLQQEHERAGRIEKDLAAARRDVKTQTALVAKAGADAIQLKKTTDAAAADLRQSLQQEHERASRLERDLTAARREVKTQTALAAKAGAEGIQLKKTSDAAAADLRQSLQQERERASRLEKDLATSRRDVEAQTARASKASSDADRLRRAADTRSAELRQVLLQGRDRPAQLERDLALTQSNPRAPSIAAADLITRQHEMTACAKGVN